mmetsp:Transcript_10901/g.26696  ORF Transcript_10901/g.26696 Transcript_10901/m.26696 type:complete len:224 (-) Transcript_10901:10-681(-)
MSASRSCTSLARTPRILRSRLPCGGTRATRSRPSSSQSSRCSRTRLTSRPPTLMPRRSSGRTTRSSRRRLRGACRGPSRGTKRGLSAGAGACCAWLEPWSGPLRGGHYAACGHLSSLPVGVCGGVWLRSQSTRCGQQLACFACCSVRVAAEWRPSGDSPSACTAAPTAAPWLGRVFAMKPQQQRPTTLGQWCRLTGPVARTCPRLSAGELRGAWFRVSIEKMD